MKCISLYQPRATLVVLGKKRLDPRSWFTLYRGPLLIHAAKRFEKPERALWGKEPFFSALVSSGIFKASDLPLGAIIGKVNLVSCLLIPVPPFRYEIGRVTIPPDEPELSFGDYTPGRYAWVFDDALWFNPIPYKGKQGLFDVPDSVLQR